MKLIPEWKQAYKYLSIQLATLLAIISAAYEYMPMLQSYLPDGWVKWFALVIIVARLIQQQKEDNHDSRS
jgi:hypothetical protein